jgi:hypothetical protein
VYLPPVRKALLYLDQFFFSGAFRGGDKRFVEAAVRVRDLADKQIIVSPFSSIHEDETHLWARRGELYEFIKATSRGHEFQPAYEIERGQILNGFSAWLANQPADYNCGRREALWHDVDQWDGYFRIDVGRYIGDIDAIRTSKKQSISDLVDAFPEWRASANTFEEDVALELHASGRSYFEAYVKYVMRIGSGDYSALIDSPIVSMIVQHMLHYLPKETAPKDQLRTCGEFFKSQHFATLPYQDIKARAFATLKAQVKAGAYANRGTAVERLSGFFHDVKHIATYAPYCQAFVMDQPMAALMNQRGLELERRYRMRAFSLNNWGEFMAWLDELEVQMSDEHMAGRKAAYP